MKIFISYSHKDIEFVTALVHPLESNGHEVWVDYREILPGAYWTQAIDKGLEQADLVLGVMTENAILSENVQNEWYWTIRYEKRLNKRLVLIKLDDFVVPHHLIRVNWIEWNRQNPEPSLAKLLQWLDLTAGQVATTIAQPAENPYHEYLQTLYSRIKQELDSLVLSVEHIVEINTRDTSYHLVDKPYMHRAFSSPDSHNTERQFKNFNEAFDHYQGRLLLLGEPGAGKTITLLNHARNATLARLQDDSQPLPLLARITTWNAGENQSLEKWLSSQTGIDEATIAHSIATGSVMLILDGLDELGKYHVDVQSGDASTFDPRTRFLSMLPETCPVIISSRSTDYKQLNHKINLNGAITLQRLSNNEIHTYLLSTPGTANLWRVLSESPDLLDIARIPIILSLLAFTYRDLPQQVRKLNDLKRGDLRNAIFQDYVQKRYDHEAQRYQNDQIPFTLERIYEVLGSIAKHSVIRYGTGRVAFLKTSNPSWGDWIVVDKLVFAFFGDEIPLAESFLNFAQNLHLIKCDDNGSCRFVHPLLRDFFISYYSRSAGEIDSYTLEALGQIDESRKYAIYEEVVTGEYTIEMKMHVLSILNNDMSDTALQTLRTMGNQVDEPFLMKQIQNVISRRAQN